MNDLLAIAAQNTIVAGILAVLVYGVTRVWRRPPVAHLLWLLVLAKLIGPPLLPLEWRGLGTQRPFSDSQNGDRELAASSPAAAAIMADRGAESILAADPVEIPGSSSEPSKPSLDESATLGTSAMLWESCRDYFQLHSDQFREGLLAAWMAGL